MKVEIWADVVCPWSYLGKRRFEAALAQFEHRDQVEVIWRSYQLDPRAPAGSDHTWTEMIAQKYGVSLAEATEMNEQVSAIVAEDGLEYHLENAWHSNTFNAHRLLHLATARGLQSDAQERFFRAYFSEGKALGDAETLVQLATEVGMAEDEARAVLESDAYADAVRADIGRTQLFGMEHVPFFVIDEQYLLRGAQPSDAIKELLEQAWAESHPLPQVVSANADDVSTGQVPQC